MHTISSRLRLYCIRLGKFDNRFVSGIRCGLVLINLVWLAMEGGGGRGCCSRSHTWRARAMKVTLSAAPRDSLLLRIQAFPAPRRSQRWLAHPPTHHHPPSLSSTSPAWTTRRSLPSFAATGPASNAPGPNNWSTTINSLVACRTRLERLSLPRIRHSGGGGQVWSGECQDLMRHLRCCRFHAYSANWA